MPLMVEPLAFERGGGGGYQSSGDVDRIMGLVRQAVELGADVIKADPTDDISEYHRVVQVARVPLLLRGGGRVTDEEILERTQPCSSRARRASSTAATSSSTRTPRR